MPDYKPPMSRNKKIGVAAAVAAAIAAPAEGIRYVAYYDPPGILTVCRGHTGKDIDPHKRYTLTECDKFLEDDMRSAVVAVDRCVPDAPEPVLAAFSDAAYNIGPTIACDTRNSTAARMLQAKDWRGACNQLPRWDKAKIAGVLVALPGLTKRRKVEQDVCLGYAAG